MLGRTIGILLILLQTCVDMREIQLIVLVFISISLSSQDLSKKRLDHADFDIWRTIDQEAISNNGAWVTYSLTTERQDPSLYIKHVNSDVAHYIPRGIDAKITEDNAFVIFRIKVSVDAIKQKKREKVKKDDLPKDTLGILNLSTREITKIPNVVDFSVPENWSGYITYTTELKQSIVIDSLETDQESKSSDESVTIIKNLHTDFELTIPEVSEHALAEDASIMAFISESEDSAFAGGVYLFDGATEELKPIFAERGNFQSLSLDEEGEQLVFLGDLDTTSAQVKSYKLFYHHRPKETTELIVDDQHWLIPLDYKLSEHSDLRFSKDGSRLFFGIAPTPVSRDTTLLDEEIVNVEVWSWTDPRLHTQQELELESDRKSNLACVWHINTNDFVIIENQTSPNARFDPDRRQSHAIRMHEKSYQHLLSWDGFPTYKDLYLVDIATGEEQLIGTKIKANPQMSPGGKYVYWYNSVDTVWQTYQIQTGAIHTITNNDDINFFDESNDRPMLPGSYGIAGWTEDDEYILIYDDYDIWKIDPSNAESPQPITNGRNSEVRYRYIDPDRETHYIDSQEPLLLSLFDKSNKSSGYARTTITDDQVEVLLKEDYRYDRRPLKARDADRYLFTKEDFRTFPDVLVADGSFKNTKKLSDANPQQSDYSWGTAEIYEWLSSDGETLQGLVIKPDDFDPQKKHPLIVNFYERSSDGLYNHRPPYPHRSTINYAFYVSRGYVIFNPDVHYKIGYPGESAENAVISGTNALIREGYIDKDKIGVQGHSWGGYQIAHLITRSNLFACAESGAPVVNMFSAYGGIRWGSGMSRMFQYEKTQSRIGGTIWDEHTRYLENSPLFYLDKVETPVLIMHNDKDGAVPWYQGIEFFVAMRRLGKPAWLLNYNDEPHWPLKRQNRLDFNVRMQQFFDHYLMDQPKPLWMEEGVSAIDVGVQQNLEPHHADSNPGSFNMEKDLLLGHFDCKTDVDDIHSVAAFKTLLSQEEYVDIKHHAVAGTYGTQGGLYVPGEEVFELAFGDNWSDAHKDFDGALGRVHDLVGATLDNDGDVWITEAGQSDFSAALVKSLKESYPELNTKQRIHIIQHSNWNEEVTSESALQYVKAHTDYQKIPDGNAMNNGSPCYRSPDFITWKSKISDKAIRDLWSKAVDIGNAYNGVDGRYLNEAVKNGGLDFSDISETCWILGLDHIKDTAEFFETYCR